MARTSPEHTCTRAQALARDAADRYFAALVSEIPFDTAPGDVDLIAAFNDIQDTLLDGDSGPGKTPDTFGQWTEQREQAAMHAGYLLGIEIGRRLGGTR
jgi:hypothetical protein